MKNVSRKKFSSEFKAKVAAEAVKEQKTIAELAIQYEIHPTQIWQWSHCYHFGRANRFPDHEKTATGKGGKRFKQRSDRTIGAI